ncbi:hypothetical protein H5410_011964, partial [Solanum commersonii]
MAAGNGGSSRLPCLQLCHLDSQGRFNIAAFSILIQCTRNMKRRKTKIINRNCTGTKIQSIKMSPTTSRVMSQSWKG